MKFYQIFFILIFYQNVYAQNVHFFGSAKAAKTTIEDNDIEFDGIKNSVTITPLTTAGISFDASINDQYQVLSQFIYKNNSSVGVDLLQVRHHFSDKTMLRVGSQRMPFNVHSENIQIQALLPWINAPREVYGRAP